MNKKNIIISGCIILLILSLLPYLFTRPSILGENLNFTHTGSIGDTIGGILGPFIAIIAAVLTFLAFYIQYQANEQQKKDLKIERFENKFYELLNLHKSNVDEMKINDKIVGRSCFMYLVQELRFCYRICAHAYEGFDSQNTEDTEKINILSFSYKLFFYGTDNNYSKKHFIQTLNEEEEHLLDISEGLLDASVCGSFKKYVSSPRNKLPYTTTCFEEEIKFYYLPYQGHINKLAHYYRHLFQTANFIKDNKFLNKQEKYEYIKTLRAQLTDHEQLLLYYNAMAWFEKEWYELFTEYRLIKNIPISLADFDINPLEKYAKEIKKSSKEGIKIFEFQ